MTVATRRRQRGSPQRGIVREVWCFLWGLDPGTLVSVREILEHLATVAGVASYREAVWKGVNVAVLAGVIERAGRTERTHRVAWRRCRLEAPLTVELLILRGMPPEQSLRFLQTLYEERYLELRPDGYHPT